MFFSSASSLVIAFFALLLWPWSAEAHWQPVRPQVVNCISQETQSGHVGSTLIVEVDMTGASQPRCEVTSYFNQDPVPGEEGQEAGQIIRPQLTEGLRCQVVQTKNGESSVRVLGGESGDTPIVENCLIQN